MSKEDNQELCDRLLRNGNYNGVNRTASAEMEMDITAGGPRSLRREGNGYYSGEPHCLR